MQMLKKLFNSKNKYYLELDEIKESDAVQAVVKTAEKVADVVKEKASEVGESEPVQKVVQTVKESADTASDKKESATTTEVKPDKKESAKPTKSKQQEKSAKSKATNKSNQNGKVAESADKTSDKPATSPENSGASSYDPPFWVAAMYNNNSNGKASESIEAEQTFATDNLMPEVTKYRRRPGGSLKKFKEMAKQAKTPKR